MRKNKTQRIMRSLYSINELLTDNLKLTDKEEDEIYNFTKEVRSQGLSPINSKDLMVIFKMLDDKNMSDDMKFKYAYKLTSGFTMASRKQFENEFPWVIREIKKGTQDTFSYPNQVGGISSYKYVGKKDGKYNFKYFGKDSYNFLGDLFLTKDQVIEKIRDIYTGLPVRVVD